MSHVGERWRTQTATLSGEDFTRQTDCQLSLSSGENRQKPVATSGKIISRWQTWKGKGG